MKKSAPTTILYLPGLGDGYDGLRKCALRFWHRRNTTVKLIPMLWNDSSEKIDHKLERVGDAIRTARKNGRRVVLIGESAGGSMALVAYALHKNQIAQVITLCGKNIGAERVSPRLYKSHPAFRQSMLRADAIVPKLTTASKKKFTIFYSKYDPTVRPIDTLIDTVDAHELRGIGHLMVIVLGLTLYKSKLLAAVKS